MSKEPNFTLQQAAKALDLTKREFVELAMAPKNRYGLHPDGYVPRMQDCRWSKKQLEHYKGEKIEEATDQLLLAISPFSSRLTELTELMLKTNEPSRREFQKMRKTLAYLCEEISRVERITLEERNKFRHIGHKLTNSNLSNEEAPF